MYVLQHCFVIYAPYVGHQLTSLHTLCHVDSDLHFHLLFSGCFEVLRYKQILVYVHSLVLVLAQYLHKHAQLALLFLQPIRLLLTRRRIHIIQLEQFNNTLEEQENTYCCMHTVK
jgi:hypothetical protein